MDTNVRRSQSTRRSSASSIAPVPPLIAPPSTPLSPFWDERKLDGDEEVLDYIQGGKPSHESKNPNNRELGTWEEPPNPLCSASFGDQGMTATVNAYGLLMQFGDYLGIGGSGVFSADHDCVNDPYYVVSRAANLDKITRSSSMGEDSYGLSLEGLKLRADMPPKLTWNGWRWPRYEYGAQHFEESSATLTVQWMVHKKTLIQRCVLECNDKDDTEINVKFFKGMRIRDLDHIDGRKGSFNEVPNDRLQGGLGPGGYSWVWRALYPSVAEDEEAAEENDETGSAEREARNTAGERAVQGDQPRDSLFEASKPETDTEPQPQETKTGLGYFHQRLKRPADPPHEEDLGTNDVKQDEATGIEDSSKERNKTSAVVVVAAIFVNGCPMKFDHEQEWSLPRVWKEPLKGVTAESSGPSRLEVVTAYRMAVLPTSNVDWSNLIIPAKDVDIPSFLQKQTFTPFPLLAEDRVRGQEGPLESKTDQKSTAEGRLSSQSSGKVDDFSSRMKARLAPLNFPSGSPLDKLPTQHMNYVMWRHLEHILSVCSVPVTIPPGSKCDVDGIQPVALTCGDLSMHRVCTSASFFAFEFLLEVAKRLHHLTNEDDRVATLQHRIKQVCTGHIKWLMTVEKPESGCFAANYWVTGEAYPEPVNNGSWQARDGVTDTPLQIIKAAEFAATYPGDTSRTLSEKLLTQLYDPWLKLLHGLDPRIKFAWPHAKEEGIYTFRLDDHVWIWKALKALDVMNIWEGWDRGSDKKGYSISDIQKEMLQRFTTKNDGSGKRMLAVTRSVRETRFLFHARDTALFYRQNTDFFMPNTSYHELWSNTIQAQIYHEDNHEIGWDNSIRYALTIVMGIRHFQINSSKTARHLVRDAVNVLFESTSPNGFFPGQLTEGTSDPVIFESEEYRDSYFHANFEVSYVLLVNSESIEDCFKKTATQKQLDVESKPATGENISRLGRSLDHLEEIEDNFEMVSNKLTHALDRPFTTTQSQPYGESGATSARKSSTLVPRDVKAVRQDEKRRVLAMKKIFPFGSLVDSTKIVEIDEEWLFNYPPFLRQTQMLPSGAEGVLELMDRKDEFDDDLISQQMEMYIEGTQTFQFRQFVECTAEVINVPKQKHVGKGKNRRIETKPEICLGDSDLWSTLRPKRTAKNAKKRLIWLNQPDVNTAIICYAATPPVHRPILTRFFEQHWKQEASVVEYTSKVYNVWYTELHFGFYVLADEESSRQYASTPDSLFYKFSASKGQVTAYASLSFRFDGDIFDRYWTCYFIGLHSTSDFYRPLRQILNERDWRQRKVLELLFLEWILLTLLRSTRPLLRMIQREIDEGRLSFAQLSSERYLATTHTQLQEVRNLLESVDESLSTTRNSLDRWDTREKDRGQQPRWTRNDERKYCESISDLRGSIERHTVELKNLHARCKTQKEKLIVELKTNVDKITENRTINTERRGLHESENMRLFTYVTVVFLPLGFAASIFSMGGTPDTPLLIDMIVCAVIALALTVVTLMNAKKLAALAQQVSLSINRYSRERMEKSLFTDSQAITKSSSNIQNAATEAQFNDSEKSWYVKFWLAYLFIELPARRVILAWHALGSFTAKEQTLEDGNVSQNSLALVIPEELPSGDPTSVATKPGHLTVTSWKIVQLLGGAFFSPLFMISWILQFICYNLLDILSLVSGIMIRYVSPADETTRYIAEAYEDLLFHPPMWWRPMRKLKQQGDADVYEPKTITEAIAASEQKKREKEFSDEGSEAVIEVP